MSPRDASDVLIFLVLLSLSGCERGCARTWLGRRGAVDQGTTRQQGPVLNAVDCPDGLARCSGGVVEASRLASIPLPCTGGAEQCACPWERLGECERGCVGDGVEVVAERGKALGQLCAPPPDAGAPALPLRSEAPRDCDDEELYRCTGGAVVSCSEHAIVGRCLRGCFAEGVSLGSDAPIGREAAFAILCSR